MGFDELMGLYDSYRVRASKIEIHITNTDTTVPFTIVCLPSLSSGTTSIVGLIGQPYVKQTYVGMATGQDTKHLTNYIKNSVLFGDKIYNTDTQFIGTSTSNPVFTQFWKIRIEATGGSGGGSIRYQACFVITYWVELFDRLQLPASVN